MLERRGIRVSLAVSLGLLALVAILTILPGASSASPSLAEGVSPQLDVNIELVCPTLVDLSWNPSLYLTDTFFGEVCEVTWGTYYMRRGPDPYDSWTQHAIGSLAAMQSFFRDENVSQGNSYWYDTVQEYTCPSGKTYLAARKLGGAPVTPGPSCEGDLMQDLSLSGVELLEPNIRVWEGATLNLTGVKVRGGWIVSAGHDDSLDPPGGVLQFSHVTLLDNARLEFNASGENLLEHSTIEGDRNPYPTDVHIGCQAEVRIEQNHLDEGWIFIEGEPQVTIAGNDFHQGAVTIQSQSRPPGSGTIQIISNVFIDAAQAVAIWQYGGYTEVSGNTFVGREESKTRNAVHVRKSVGTEHWGGLSDFWGNKVFGYDTALSVGERVTVSVEGNLIQDCNTGFFLRYDSDATLRNNTVVSCGKALTVWDEPTAKLRHNCIAANVTGIDISPFAGERLSIDATENWWGHASGPLHPTNPDGQGNYVGSRATITPWLTMDNCFVDVASAVIGPAGGTVSTTSGAASVSLPAGAVSQDTRVSIRPMKPSAMDTMPAPPGGLSPVRLFQAAAQDDATGTPVTELDEGAAFSARLSQAEAAGVDPATLTLARLEAGASSSQGGAAPGTTPAWALLPTQVDLVSVALTATSEYLGTFAVLGEPTAASIYLPLVSRSGVLP